MNVQHAKAVRRLLLLKLYQCYAEDPLAVLAPEDLLEDGAIRRENLLLNIHYLHDRGLVELMTAFNPPFFASARISADGVDLVENRFEFDLRFPPVLGELEDSLGQAPALLEQLFSEAELSPLDGEERRALLRDIQFLRDEMARPAAKWRFTVIRAVLDWMEDHFKGSQETISGAMPSWEPLKKLLAERLG